MVVELGTRDRVGEAEGRVVLRRGEVEVKGEDGTRVEV